MSFKELEAKLTLDAEEFEEDVQEAKEALRELEEAATDAGEAIGRLNDHPTTIRLDLSDLSDDAYVKSDELERILEEREERAIDDVTGGVLD